MPAAVRFPPPAFIAQLTPYERMSALYTALEKLRDHIDDEIDACVERDEPAAEEETLYGRIVDMSRIFALYLEARDEVHAARCEHDVDAATCAKCHPPAAPARAA